MKSILFILSFLLVTTTFATEVHTIVLAPVAKFSAPNAGSCDDLKTGNPINLRMLMKDGKIVSAHFDYHAYPHDVIGPEFTAQEIAAIQLYRDPFNRLWLTSLRLSYPQLWWWVARGNWDFVFDHHPVNSISTASVDLKFSTDGLGEEILFSYSNCSVVNGVFKNGSAFTMNFEFMERQVQEIRGGGQ